MFGELPTNECRYNVLAAISTSFIQLKEVLGWHSWRDVEASIPLFVSGLVGIEIIKRKGEEKLEVIYCQIINDEGDYIPGKERIKQKEEVEAYRLLTFLIWLHE